ncbi:MAG: hypothetical protein F6K47_37465 [Symploca sp. SIO2E6]|nr:hypothetical protein [Symploca sp. SIO2E6]
MGIGNWELGIGNRELGIGNKYLCNIIWIQHFCVAKVSAILSPYPPNT